MTESTLRLTIFGALRRFARLSSIFPVANLMTWTALLITSAGCFRLLGPLGIFDEPHGLLGSLIVDTTPERLGRELEKANFSALVVF